MRFLTILTAILLIAGAIFAETPTVYDRFDILREARLLGGEHVYFYYSGQDTIAPAAYVDSVGFDSLIQIDDLQLAWSDQTSMDSKLDGKTYTGNDRLAYLSPRYFALWIMQDTTTFSYADTSYGGYCDADSCGIDPTIMVTFAMDQMDIDSSYDAWIADSTNIVIEDDQYSDEDFYGNWVWNDCFPADVLANSPIKRWYIFIVRVPPGAAYASFTINSVNTMLETPVVRWRLVCVH